MGGEDNREWLRGIQCSPATLTAVSFEEVRPDAAVAFAANPKFLAVAASSDPAAGVSWDIHVRGLLETSSTCRLEGHSTEISQLLWHPFNDNLLASADTSGVILLWEVDDSFANRIIRKQHLHTRRVESFAWHPTVDDLLLSASADGKLILWDAAADSVLFQVEDWHASCVCWHPLGAIFAATSRHSHRLCVFDGRTGAVRKSVSLPHDGSMASKVVFLTGNYLLTTGNTYDNERRFTIHSQASLDKIHSILNIDDSHGDIYPFFDADLRVLYISGKNDSRILAYSICLPLPLIFIGAFSLSSPHRLLSQLPKRALHLPTREIFRFYRILTAEGSMKGERVSFHAPNREQGFSPEFYPPTVASTAALTLPEWLAGVDRPALPLQLLPNIPGVTNKTIPFAPPASKSKLPVSSALSGDLKFRFLSQVTKADYRNVMEREDSEEVMKTERIKRELDNQRRDVEEESRSQSQTKETPELRDGSRRESPSSESESTSREPLPPSASSPSLTQQTQSISQEQILSLQAKQSEAQGYSDSLTAPLAQSTDEDLSPTDEKISCLQSEALPMQSELPGVHSLSRSVSWQPSEEACNGNECEAAEEGMMCRKPRDEENKKLLENAVVMLERQLRKADTRNERLLRRIHLNKEDIESLRFEIEWKDKRIKELEAALALHSAPQ